MNRRGFLLGCAAAAALTPPAASIYDTTYPTWTPAPIPMEMLLETVPGKMRALVQQRMRDANRVANEFYIEHVLYGRDIPEAEEFFWQPQP